jgi:hypothetical protein
LNRFMPGKTFIHWHEMCRCYIEPIITFLAGDKLWRSQNEVAYIPA